MKEKEMVKRLGELIGYGNMMHLASQCWQEMLIEKYGSPVGAFTVGPCVGDEGGRIVANTAEDEGWISVEDRLPEATQLVIVVWRNLMSGARLSDTAWIDENGIWTNREGHLANFGYYVTHWMPLPEPPEDK